MTETGAMTLSAKAARTIGMLAETGAESVVLRPIRDRADVGWLVLTERRPTRGGMATRHYVLSPSGRIWRVTDPPDPGCDPYWVRNGQEVTP